MGKKKNGLLNEKNPEKIMEAIEKRIKEFLLEIEVYDKKVLHVDKENKNDFISFFPEFVINPGCLIENSTIVTYKDDKISIKNYSIFIFGLYIKKQRNVSQTPMPGVENAVSDIFKNFVSFYKADDFKFVPAGREDKDVLNIKGRPFYVEIINPKLNLRTKIPENYFSNEFVTLQNVKKVKGNLIKKFILEGERNHKKIYSLIVHCSKKQNIKDLIFKNLTNETISLRPEIIKSLLNKKIEIKQKTPFRVLHRRSNLERIREMEILDFKEIDNYLSIRLKASAGAYVKEFVSGDMGRTTPSLSSLFDCFCDCVQLDVEEIENSELPIECLFE